MNNRDRIDWNQLIDNRDAQTLADIAGRELGLILPADAFLAECRVAKGRTYEPDNLGGSDRITGWSDCTWRAWLKNRADSLGCYRTVNPTTNEIRWASCTLHIGFMFIEETQEHLDILAQKVDPPIPNSVARSKIGTTSRVIRPIDRVADRVAPDTER
jgi:hypothetical protein